MAHEVFIRRRMGMTHMHWNEDDARSNNRASELGKTVNPQR